jgi:hypothetical protein
VEGTEFILTFLECCRMKRLMCLFLYGLCISLSLARAQSTNATLSGGITDPAGTFITGAEIDIANDTTGVVYTTKTNSSGIYYISLLPPGNYHVQVSKIGFKTVIKPDVVLNVQSAMSLNFSLPVGATSESITVDAASVVINSMDASVSTVIDRQFVENMPLNGRSFQSLETLVPGTSLVPSKGTGLGGEITVNGQRTEENYFTVDGVSVNTGVNGMYTAGTGAGFSGSVPGETALGTTQSLVSIDDLQEFRVTSSTYSAEYGRTPGGQFSFVTRSGANVLHGSLYDYFRNDAFDANNWFNDHTVPATRKTAERQNDFGGTFSGPVWIPRLYQGHDKTFFFFSYEGLRLTTPHAAVVTSVPDSTLRSSAPSALQPVLNAFPLPNGSELGSGFATFEEAYSTPSKLDSTSLRVDHHFSDNASAFLRYSYSPSSAASRYAGNLAETASSVFSSQPMTLGIDNNFGLHRANELRLNFTPLKGNYNYAFTNFGNATPFPLSTVPGPNGGTLPTHSQVLVSFSFGNYPSLNYGPQPISQQQWNVTDSFSIQLGLHALKFGVDYRRLTTEPKPPTFWETVVFTSESQVLSNTAATATVKTSAAIPSQPIYTNLSLFAQDEWRATSRLNVSLGLRWELNPPPGDGYGNIPYTLNETSNLATAAIAPKGTPLWHTTYNNFAPRVALAYQIHRHQGYETVLRSGFGVFYDTGNTLGSQGISGLGYAATNTLTNVSFPLSDSETDLPTASVVAPYNGTVYAFSPDLKLPYTFEWNTAIEQALGKKQTLTLTYLGSGAHSLLTEYLYYPAQLGNTNFKTSGLAYITQNQASSGYNALQIQYDHHLSNGLQALLSYTWSHSIDNNSSNFGTNEGLLRGNSDFDIRHNFQAALTYNMPFHGTRGVYAVFLRDWSLDARISARSALPLDVYSGYTPLAGGFQQYVRADMVPGVAVYKKVAGVPGGRIVNANAFRSPATGYLGNEPRNFVRGFASWQPDITVRREIPLIDKAHLQFRAEAFNLFNHPNFGAIYNSLSNSTQFGYAYNTLNSQLGGLNSLYQVGGPRSLQIALRVAF